MKAYTHIVLKNLKGCMCAITRDAYAAYVVEENRIMIETPKSEDPRPLCVTLLNRTFTQGIELSSKEIAVWGLDEGERVTVQDRKVVTVTRYVYYYPKTARYYLVPAAVMSFTPESSPDKLIAIMPVIPAIEVEKWKVQYGDIVTYALASDQIVIQSVNGRMQPGGYRPNFQRDILGQTRFAHPVGEFPLDIQGKRSMRIKRALSPLGMGSFGIFSGPSKCGKTWLLRDTLESLLEITRQDLVLKAEKTAFVVIMARERDVDIRKMRMLLARYEELEIHFFYGSELNTEAMNFLMAEQTTRRLIEEGKDVITTLDSVLGLVSSLGQILDPQGKQGFAGKAVSRAGLTYVRQNYLKSGVCPLGGSITLLVTMVIEGDSASKTVYEEIGGQAASSEDRLRTPAPGEERPIWDLGVSGTRETQDMFDTQRASLHAEIQSRAYRQRNGDGEDDSRRKPGEAMAYLQKLFAGRPFDTKALAAVWAEEDEAAAKAEEQKDKAELLAAGDKLRNFPGNKAEAIMLMLARAGIAPWEQALMFLLKNLPEKIRLAFLALLTKEGLIGQSSTVEVSAEEVFLGAADRLRGRVDATETLLEAIRRMGIDPSLLENGQDAAQALMDEVNPRLAAAGKKELKIKIAARIADAGWPANLVLQRLLSDKPIAELFESYQPVAEVVSD